MAICITAKKNDGEEQYRVWSTHSEDYLSPWLTRDATVEFLEEFYAGNPGLLETAFNLIDVALRDLKE